VITTMREESVLFTAFLISPAFSCCSVSSLSATHHSLIPFPLQGGRGTTLGLIISIHVNSCQAVKPRPVESSQVQSSPVESSRIQSCPVESSRVQSSPIESRRVQTSPGESRRVQSSPVESQNRTDDCATSMRCNREVPHHHPVSAECGKLTP